MRWIVLFAMAVLPLSQGFAQSQNWLLDKLPQDAVAQGVVAQEADMAGRKALKIELTPQVVRSGPGRGGYGDEPTYLALPIDFGNGTLEIDLYGKLNGQGADVARAFIGLVFRAAADRSSFEALYLRPTNGRKANPGKPRDQRAVQYFHYPDGKFDRLRKDFPYGRYEAGADIDQNEWITLRLEIQGASLKAFVNNKLELVVPDMKYGSGRRGQIGLWVDIGTEGYFSNLRISQP
jgi:hypothetical protein